MCATLRTLQEHNILQVAWTLFNQQGWPLRFRKIIYSQTRILYKLYGQGLLQHVCQEGGFEWIQYCNNEILTPHCRVVHYKLVYLMRHPVPLVCVLVGLKICVITFVIILTFSKPIETWHHQHNTEWLPDLGQIQGKWAQFILLKPVYWDEFLLTSHFILNLHTVSISKFFPVWDKWHSLHIYSIVIRIKAQLLAHNCDISPRMRSID